jgi:hypothetical protein
MTFAPFLLAASLFFSLSADLADRDCRVVLRDVARVPDGRGGYQTSTSGSWIWEGSVEVAGEGVPSILYQSGSDPTWWEVEAVAAAEPGRYHFRLEHHLPGPGMSGTSLARARVQLIPVLRLPGGERLFDHNRHAGDFDTYELSGATGSFAIADDVTACPAADEAVLRFDAAWNERAEQEVVAGGALIVDYSLVRLDVCRGTHNGYPAWDVVAHARFSPGGQELRASVRGFETLNGFPTTRAYALPARFAVPADATSVELWFENFGLWCQAWDSDFGKNYRFSVRR